MKKRILLKNGYVLSMRDDHIVKADVIIEDKYIVFVGDNVAKDDYFDEIIDVDNNLLMPSFKNGHTHSAMIFARSIGDNLSLEDWLFNLIIPMENKLTYDDVFSMVKADPQAMQVLPSGGDYLIPLSAINKGETPLNYYSVYVIVHAQTMQADYWSGGCETSPGLTPYSEFSLGQTTIVPAYWDPNFAGLNTLFQG